MSKPEAVGLQGPRSCWSKGNKASLCWTGWSKSGLLFETRIWGRFPTYKMVLKEERKKNTFQPLPGFQVQWSWCLGRQEDTNNRVERIEQVLYDRLDSLISSLGKYENWFLTHSPGGWNRGNCRIEKQNWIWQNETADGTRWVKETKGGEKKVGGER